MSRWEDVMYDFIEGDKIWPPNLAPTSFLKALKAVLMRLPDDAYDEVSERVSFVVELPEIMLATNVPFIYRYPPCPNGLEVRFDTIVVFHEAMAYPKAALMGLLAHELAHSLVNKPDYMKDEEAADALVLNWGFDREFEALKAEQKARQRKFSQKDCTTLKDAIKEPDLVNLL